MQIHEISQHNIKYWVSDDVYADFNPDWFRSVSHPEMLHKQGGAGRQAVTRKIVSNMPMVLRHYYRGGAPARLSRDKFIFTGYQSTRPFCEINLLNNMLGKQLPVPRPVAARCVRQGMTYQADILMHEIVNVQTLIEKLSQMSLADNVWEKIGGTISRFHRSGIQHVDLNAHNILINDQQDIYLVDFDRCKQKVYSSRWAQQGLKRLERSLQKEKARNGSLNYDQDLFLYLRKGYQSFA